MVRVCSSSRSTSRSTTSRRVCSEASTLRPRSGHLHRRGCVHEDPRLEDSVQLLCAALRQMHSIRRSVSKPVLLSLLSSLVLSRLDYGSATLAGIPTYMFDRLQSVLNAAARLIDIRKAEVRPCYSTASGPALAERPGAY